MNKFALSFCAAVFGFLFAALAPAQAAPVYFGDKASFDAATTNTLIEDFLGFADGSTDTLGDGFVSNGITYTRLTGTVSTQKLLVVEGNPFFGPGTVSHVLTDNNDDHWRMDFSSPSRAVGFDTYLNFIGTANIQIFDTSNNLIDTFVQAHEFTNVGFFGILADQNIGSIIWRTFDGSTQNTGLTNIVQGSAINVPAPGALLLLGFGLIGLGAARRK